MSGPAFATTAVIVALASLFVGLIGLVAAGHRSARGGQSRRSWRGGELPWWPEFERQFAEYVKARAPADSANTPPEG
jgi:hypothetical protein